MYISVGSKGTEIKIYKVTQADRQTLSMMRGSWFSKHVFEVSEQFTGNEKRRLIVGWLDHEGLRQLQNSFVVDETFVVKRLGQTILHLTSSCRRPVGTIVGGYEVRSSRSNDVR